MTSRTPIRLTPHRGPLATPPASPECSPTLSASSTDTSYSTAIESTLDIDIPEDQNSTLGLSMQHQHGFLLRHWRHGITEPGPFGRCAHISPLSLILDNLLYSANELGKTVVGTVTFCLFIWGLLEWSSYASELPRQPNAWAMMSRLPLPPPTRALHCHTDPYLCEPSNQHGAMLQFLSEQIQHAKALSSLSAGLGSPLHTFLETHQATTLRVVVRRNLSELPHLIQEVDPLANLTDYLESPLLSFTSSSFVGRSFTLALEELGDLIFEPVTSHTSSIYGNHQDVHLHAIYWRTASNLLLEYSAVRPRVKQLLQHLRITYQRLTPLALGRHVTQNIEVKSNTWWWKGSAPHPATSVEDRIQAFVAGLEAVLDNVHRLTAYLDWVTEQLSRTTLGDVLESQHRTDFSACMLSLQELFAQSKPLPSTQPCLCLDEFRDVPLVQPGRVNIMVPGSPTVRADR